MDAQRIRDVMRMLETMPQGRKPICSHDVGEDGPALETLMAAAERGVWYDNDATYHVAQAAWRSLEAMYQAEVMEANGPQCSCSCATELADAMKWVSFWKLQYKAAGSMLFNFIELFDASDGCVIAPPIELIEGARWHFAKSHESEQEL